jgi:L-ascorbate metabolism protein UlaG (beta-lactamase superfamily)
MRLRHDKTLITGKPGVGKTTLVQKCNRGHPFHQILQNPTHDVPVTWIRHASFLIQLGGKYQNLIDPVLEQWDGLAGTFAKYTAIEAPNAKSPLTAEDLPFSGGSEYPGKNVTVIVAISHDHLDHFNFRPLKKLSEYTRYYVPHGLESKFPSRYSNVIGMDWYIRDTIGELIIHYLADKYNSAFMRKAAFGLLSSIR